VANLDCDLSSVHLNERNTPLGNKKNTPLTLSTQTYSSHHRRYTNSDTIIDIAIKKFRKNQRGITFKDLMKQGLVVHKRQAQETLKYYRRKDTLFTLRLRRPQEYFATPIKSEVIEKFSKITPIDPTGVTNYLPHLSSKRSPLCNCVDNIVIQSLEGYVLPLLRTAPSYIHNMHFKTKISSEYHCETIIQQLRSTARNGGKQLTEVIGSARVVYTFYRSGTVNVEVKCTNNPFRLENEIDHSSILVFFGQIRDRLITFLTDRHERIVPALMNWYITEFDLNKDVKVSNLLQFSGINIQVRHLDHVFRIYVKSMGEHTVCRIEESKHTQKPILQAINDIFNPWERAEKMLQQIIDNTSYPFRDYPHQ
jgi:hypothetical protein